jgi:hypothetical protein
MADQQALHAFAQWVAGCSGNEKQEGQTFVQKLLTAWGWADATEAGVSFEHKIPKGGAGGGMGYADALIPGKVLIEMKQRGEALGQHFPQLQRYWFNLAPKPTYAILCNFDAFWVYDFNLQVDEPVEQLHTAHLPERWPGLAFLSKQPETPLFGNNQVVVTEKQASAMGALFRELKQQAAKSGQFTDHQAQRFVLQCVLCMFAEDREMLPNRQFSLALETCREKGESTYDVLGGLFNAMNTPGVSPGGRFKGTPYFNGGLFSEIPQIDLSPEQLGQLIDSAREDWRLVRPSIFGNIFEASSDAATRHAHGQHFTSEVDMLQIIRPTIVEPWEERIAKASTFAELEGLRQALIQYRVCDPACGSGNFLYMGYNAIKDLEVSILRRIEERRTAKKEKDQLLLGLVTPLQFFGMDTSPFAVELARVTLMIARKVANDRLGLTERDLPLDNLDNNIKVADALFTPWPEADVYVGNPPFLGGKFMRLNLGDDYVERVFQRFPDVRDSVDFCTYWFRLAQDNLKLDGRAGLVGTNSVRQGKSRRASLDYIRDNGGYIHSAISSQPWSGEANVHVSIVNWSLEEPVSCQLDGVEVAAINTSLRSTVDVSEALPLQANKDYCFQGVKPVGKGFNIDAVTAESWLLEDPQNSEVIKLFSMGTNLAQYPLGKPDRWIIDFNDKTLEESEIYRKPFQQVKEHVKPQRMNSRDERSKLNWWRHERSRPEMRLAIAPLDFCFAVPRVSKWAIFVSFHKDWLPGDLNVIVASEDLYVLGLLTSDTHRQWMHAQKSTLEDRTRYTHHSIFETFPFPQHVSQDLVEKIRLSMTTLNDYRNEVMVAKNSGITDLYNAYFDEPASRLAKLHQALDALVLKAYGWKASEDILSNLLDLNLELADLESAGQAIVGPWDPSRPPKPANQ